MTKREKQRAEKFEVLTEIVNALQPAYVYASQSKKALMETIIGAAIFYMPALKNKCYTGFVSEAVKAGSGRKVKEHLYPRKVSGRELLSAAPVTVDKLMNLYFTKYGRYNYVTRKENSRLRPYQKAEVFVSPEDSYRKANIRLVTE